MAKTTLSTEERPVRVDAGRVTLEGDLSVPPHARAVVLFAHGSGSSRFSSRNKRMAAFFNDSAFATLLIDLLTPNEDEIDARTREYRFDIGRLAERLIGAVEWLPPRPAAAQRPFAPVWAGPGGGAPPGGAGGGSPCVPGPGARRRG